MNEWIPLEGDHGKQKNVNNFLLLPNNFNIIWNEYVDCHLFNIHSEFLSFVCIDCISMADQNNCSCDHKLHSIHTFYHFVMEFFSLAQSKWKCKEYLIKLCSGLKKNYIKLFNALWNISRSFKENNNKIHTNIQQINWINGGQQLK